MMLTTLMGIFFASNMMAQTWQIGSRDMTFIDATRGNRVIETIIFYPADITGYQVALGSPSDKKFPVIVFGHDKEVAWNNYQYLWDQLVKRGFILAIPKTEMGSNPNAEEFAKDLAFVTSQFVSMRYDVSSFFYKRHNSKSCVMGHGMGGGAATLAVQYNPAITTLVTLAATETVPSAISAASSITIPAVVVAGGEDCVSPVATNQMPMFNNLASDCKTFINLEDASHCNFAQNAGACTSTEVLCNGFPTSYQNTDHTTTYFIVSFMRYYMKSNAPALAKFEWKLQQKKKNVSYMMACNNNAPRFTAEDSEDSDLSEDFAMDQVKMYPNPALKGGGVNFSFNSAFETDATVYITNLMGQTVVKQQIMIDEDYNEIGLPIENLKSGYYMVTVANEGGKISKPLIIQ